MVQAEIEAEQILAENDEAENDQSKADYSGQRSKGPEGEAEERDTGGHAADRGVGRHAGKSRKRIAQARQAEAPGAKHRAANGNDEERSTACQEQRHALGARRWQRQLRWNFSH